MQPFTPCFLAYQHHLQVFPPVLVLRIIFLNLVDSCYFEAFRLQVFSSILNLAINLLFMSIVDFGNEDILESYDLTITQKNPPTADRITMLFQNW